MGKGNDVSRPEWVPEGADKSVFATEVMKGVEAKHDGFEEGGFSKVVKKRPVVKRKTFSVAEYKDGILSGNKT
ncbi:MAG: hypothetical protein IKO42_06225, partial [Opitutales bacterium]|nr:hypothetical protein [Opitutales bacterium]